jgi:hypothetical protein
VGGLTGFPRPAEGPVLVVDPPAQWARAARAAGWRVQRTPLGPLPWRQQGVLVVPAEAPPAPPAAPAGVSLSAPAGASPAEVLVTILSRGAGVLLPGPGAPGGLGDDHDVVLADARRLGAVVWPWSRPTPTPFGLDPDTVRLLDGLARGWHVGAAARAANMSLRTAHRRLRRARESLGAATTAEAVGRWAQRARVPTARSAS